MQPVPGAGGGLDDQGGGQAGDLVAGQRYLARWPGATGVLGGCGDGKECAGEHGQGDPPVPGGPAPDLVFVQAGQALADLEILLDAPSAPGDPDQDGERDVPGRVAAVVGQFPGAPGCGLLAAAVFWLHSHYQAPTTGIPALRMRIWATRRNQIDRQATDDGSPVPPAVAGRGR